MQKENVNPQIAHFLPKLGVADGVKIGGFEQPKPRVSHKKPKQNRRHQAVGAVADESVQHVAAVQLANGYEVERSKEQSQVTRQNKRIMNHFLRRRQARRVGHVSFEKRKQQIIAQQYLAAQIFVGIHHAGKSQAVFLVVGVDFEDIIERG